MNQIEFNQIIANAQNDEYNRLRDLDVPAFYAALEQFAVASGFGQWWETDIDGIRYSISKIDGTFKAKKAKFTTQVKSVEKPIKANVGTCFECDQPEDDHDPTCFLAGI